MIPSAFQLCLDKLKFKEKMNENFKRNKFFMGIFYRISMLTKHTISLSLQFSFHPPYFPHTKRGVQKRKLNLFTSYTR